MSWGSLECDDRLLDTADMFFDACRPVFTTLLSTIHEGVGSVGSDVDSEDSTTNVAALLMSSFILLASVESPLLANAGVRGAI